MLWHDRVVQRPDNTIQQIISIQWIALLVFTVLVCCTVIYPVEKKSQLDKARTSAMCVVDLGTLHLTRCVLRRKSCVLTVAREGTGQRVEGMRQMERVMEEEVSVIVGNPVVLPVDVI